MIISASRSKEETVGVLEKRMLGPGMEICALKRGTGRQSKEFTQGLPTTSSVGWLLLVHGLCVLQTQPREEGAVGLSCESSFLGGQHHQCRRGPAPTSGNTEPSRGAPGRHTWAGSHLRSCPSLCLSLGTKMLPEARSRGLPSSAIILPFTVSKGGSSGTHEDKADML